MYKLERGSNHSKTTIGKFQTTEEADAYILSVLESEGYKTPYFRLFLDSNLPKATVIDYGRWSNFFFLTKE